MNSEVSRKPEPQRALLGFLRFDPVTNEPWRQLSDAIQKRASGNLLEEDFWTTSRCLADRLLLGITYGHGDFSLTEIFRFCITFW